MKTAIKSLAFVGVVSMCGLVDLNARAEEITLESARPVIVRTIPESGVADVDPKFTEVQVTFSKDMQDRTWSWAQMSKASFPKVDGKIRYLADKRTCVLPVKLEAGKTYAIWLNSQKFGNFKDPEGRPAVPYLLVFKTKS
jgi:RNA polymerase sigma-70 factor (ECF subfamily)